MASRGPGPGQPEVGFLYKTTNEALEIFGKLSLTSQFKVSLHLTNGGDDLMNWLAAAGITSDGEFSKFDFYCAETSLPGATFDVTEEIGSRQGVIERFPTKRVYPDVTMTFYVDYDYKLIRLFEEWMNYINPVYTKDAGEVAPNSKGQGTAKIVQTFLDLNIPTHIRELYQL